MLWYNKNTWFFFFSSIREFLDLNIKKLISLPCFLFISFCITKVITLKFLSINIYYRIKLWYSFYLRMVGKRLISLIALALNLDDQYFEKIGAFHSPMSFLRLIHYPGKLLYFDHFSLSKYQLNLSTFNWQQVGAWLFLHML